KADFGFATWTVPHDRREADVIHLRIVAPGTAPGNADLELTGQVVILVVATQSAVDFQCQRRGVANFVAVDTRERASGHVASNVTASTDGGKSRGPQRLHDFGERFDGDPVKLHVLANGNVGDAPGMPFGEIRDGASLAAGQQAVGNANTDHEISHRFAFTIFAADHAEAVALSIDTPRPEIRAQPLGRDGGKADARELLDFV